MEVAIVRLDEEKKKAFHAAVVEQGLTIFAILEAAIDIVLDPQSKGHIILLKAAKLVYERRRKDDRRRI